MKKIVWIAVMALCIAFLVGSVSAAAPKYPGVPPEVKIVDDSTNNAGNAGGAISPVVSEGTVVTPYFTRFYQHGGAAILESPAAVSGYNYWTWGLIYNLKPGQCTFVHSHPTSPNYDGKIKARYVVVQWYLWSADVGIDRIEVWNGATPVKVFTYSGATAIRGPGYKTVTLDLGNYYDFNRGLGVSVRTCAGIENMNHAAAAISAGGHYKFE